MSKYSPELREAALRRILPPNCESIASVSRAIGVSIQTLINWKKKAAQGADANFSNDEKEKFSSTEKFDIVVASAAMNESELGEFARSKGVFVEEIKSWRRICEMANDKHGKETKRVKRELKERDQKIHGLEATIQKKDKVIAELTAEIVLRKKAAAIWGGAEAE